MAHPLMLAAIVAAVSGCCAALRPYASPLGFLKSFISFFAGLCGLMAAAALLGRAFHSFMLG